MCLFLARPFAQLRVYIVCRFDSNSARLFSLLISLKMAVFEKWSSRRREQSHDEKMTFELLDHLLFSILFLLHSLFYTKSLYNIKMTPSIEVESSAHVNGAAQNLPQVEVNSMGVSIQKKSLPSQGELDSSKLIKTLSESPKELPSMEGLVWGTAFSDHMLSIKWTAEKGWLTPEIKPYGGEAFVEALTG